MNKTVKWLLNGTWVAMMLFCQQALADWNLDDKNSTLNFVSTKNDSVTEVHHFKTLSGTLGSDGKVAIDITLSSVDTKVPVRDERMGQMLFNVKDFPQAMLTAQLNVAQLKKLEKGQLVIMPLETELSLHGKSKTIDTSVSVTRLSDGGFQVDTIQPIIVNAADFGLDKGVEALKNIAKLDSIALGVPVTAHFVFKAQ